MPYNYSRQAAYKEWDETTGWGYRREEKKRREEQDRKDFLKSQIENDLKALTPEERELAEKEMREWPETIKEWKATLERIKKENAERAARNWALRRKQFLKIYDEIASDMHRSGWRRTDDLYRVTYAYTDPEHPEYTATVTHTDILKLRQGERGWYSEGTPHITIPSIVIEASAWKGGNTSVYSKKVVLGMDKIGQLDDLVEKYRKICVGAILKEIKKIEDDFESEKSEALPASPGPEERESWPWQNRLKERQEAEKDRDRRQQQLNDEFIEQIGRDMDASGWVDDGYGKWSYTRDDYKAVIGYSMDWGGDFIEGTYVVVYRVTDGVEKEIYRKEIGCRKHERPNPADAERLKKMAMGAIEKDQRNLQGPQAELHPTKKEAPPTPPSASPGAGDREEQIAKVKRLGEAAAAGGNDWVTTFCKSIAYQLSQGRTLSEKQLAVLEKNYKTYKIATRQVYSYDRRSFR